MRKNVIIFSALFSLLFYTSELSARPDKPVQTAPSAQVLAVGDTSNVGELLQLVKKLRDSDLSGALHYGKLALSRSLAQRDTLSAGEAANQLANIYLFMVEYDSGLSVLTLVRPWLSVKPDLKLQLGFNLNITGVLYRYKGDYLKALENHSQALSYFESLKNYSGLSLSYNNIADIYLSEQRYKQAFEHYQKGLQYARKAGDPQRVIINLSDIGQLFFEQEDYKAALSYLDKALKEAGTNQNFYKVAETYAIRAKVYVALNEHDNAIVNYHKALAIAQNTGNVLNQIRICNQLSQLYAILNIWDEALQYAERSLRLSRKVQHKQFIKENLELVAGLYAQTSNYPLAYRYQKEFTNYSDSLANIQLSRSLNQQLNNYQLQQQEQTIAIMQKEDEFRQSIIRYTLALLVLSTLFISTLLLSIRKQKKANSTLKELNQSMEQKQEELASQQRAIEQKNRELYQSADKLQKNMEVALSIQHAIMPPSDAMLQILGNYFLLNRPRDIVSGDFFWIHPLPDGACLVALADCTGHGVAGAFISLVGKMLLDEIMASQHYNSPAAILDRLHQRLYEVMYRQYAYSEPIANAAREKYIGMDIGLLMLHPPHARQRKVVYAGARRNLLVGNKLSGTISEIQGDRITLGSILHQGRMFSNHELSLPEGTRLYLFSDGFSDQNNIHRKKFGMERFRHTLAESLCQSMAVQQGLLEEALDEHQQGTIQRDDIMVAGIEL